MTAQVPVDWKDFWDLVAHIGTVIGLLATGIWAYFNFIKSRRYYPRLELAISREIVALQNHGDRDTAYHFEEQ